MMPAQCFNHARWMILFKQTRKEVDSMLKTGCINPEIMKVLSGCGHGDQILIADGNYPLQTKSGDAHKVYLGLRKDLPGVTEVLRTLCEHIVIEDATVMVPARGPEPEIFLEFRTVTGLELTECSRWEFYEKACEPSVRLAIATGESRTFANIILTVGVA
jgi:L-fucose mutarotase